MKSRALTHLLLLVGCLLIPSLSLDAQGTGVGVVDGVVTDTALTPLAAALVLVDGSSVAVATGPNGRFRISRLPTGVYHLSIRRLGYSPSTANVMVSAADTVRISIELIPIPTELPRVLVSSRPSIAALAEFYERRSLGQGQFMTEGQIEARNSVMVRELLRTFLGVDFVQDRQAINRRAGPGRHCPFQFFIDDVAIPTPDVEQDLPSPKVLAGIEVYTSAARVPPRYATAGGGAFCGVILLWTKHGK